MTACNRKRGKKPTVPWGRGKRGRFLPIKDFGPEEGGGGKKGRNLAERKQRKRKAKWPQTKKPSLEKRKNRVI